MLFNGLGIVRFQVIVVSINALLSFPVRLLFLEQFGVWGLPLATCVVYFLVAIVPFAVFLPRVLRLNERR
jgi:hypothetical protein